MVSLCYIGRESLLWISLGGALYKFAITFIITKVLDGIGAMSYYEYFDYIFPDFMGVRER